MTVVWDIPVPHKWKRGACMYKYIPQRWRYSSAIECASIFIQVVLKFIMCHSHISLCILTEDIRGMSGHLACWSHFSLAGHRNCLYTLISFAALFWFWGNDSNIRYMPYSALECVVITDNMIPIYCIGTLTACNNFWGILIIHATNERSIKTELNIVYFFLSYGKCNNVSFLFSEVGSLFFSGVLRGIYFHTWSCVIEK
jgi:hypothetical protein